MRVSQIFVALGVRVVHQTGWQRPHPRTSSHLEAASQAQQMFRAGIPRPIMTSATLASRSDLQIGIVGSFRYLDLKFTIVNEFPRFVRNLRHKTKAYMLIILLNISSIAIIQLNWP